MTQATVTQTGDYAPGTFCWVELGARDGEGAKQFYTALFDWDSTDSPGGPGPLYTLLKQDGKEVGALYQLSPEIAARGLPPQWMPYVAVAGADEAAAKVEAAGGTLVKAPFDVSTAGRMAVVADPTGAVLALWQAGTRRGAGIVNVPNSFYWHELGTSDVERAAEFYARVFGWTASVQHLGSPCYSVDYTMLSNGGRPVAGMYKVPLDRVQGPPRWTVYFAVGDCEAMSRKAVSLGATLVSRTMILDGIGEFAVLLDPQGAPFAVVKLEPGYVAAS